MGMAVRLGGTCGPRAQGGSEHGEGKFLPLELGWVPKPGSPGETEAEG